MANEIQYEIDATKNDNSEITVESPFTPEQRRILGKAYRLILSWKPEPRVTTTIDSGRQTAKTSKAGRLPAERGA